MSRTLTLRIDEELDAELSWLAAKTHRSKSDSVRDFIHEQPALAALERAQCALRPLAGKAGYLADEDSFREFS